MFSSTYRSALDQRVIYDTFQSLYGKEYVHDYVAVPGASEHQTGLAVDIATASRDCSVDANACSLDADAMAWLRAHAADYGFIERYPSGKQSITGVAGEHWHYRYVGVPLAKALDGAHMTLDEFVQQTAPGYAR
jgi:D-alanyl-D-alanine carboxypeptidase